MSNRIKSRADYWSRQGAEVYLIKEDDPNFLQLIIELDSLPHTVFYWGVAFYISLYRMGKLEAIYKNLQSPSVGVIGDHPFAPWLIEHLASLSDKIVIFGKEPCYQSVLKVIVPNYSQYRSGQTSSYPLGSHHIRVVPFSDRFIDILVPMDMRMTYIDRDKLRAEGQQLHLPNDWVDQTLDDLHLQPDIYPFDLMREHLAPYYDVTELRNRDVSKFMSLMSFCHNMDMCQRGERRLVFLRDLIESNPDATIMALCNESELLPSRDNVSYLGWTKYKSYKNLLAHSHACAFVSPSYPHVINERLYDILPLHVGTITPLNQALKQLEFKTVKSELRMSKANFSEESFAHDLMQIQRPGIMEVLFEIFKELIYRTAGNDI